MTIHLESGSDFDLRKAKAYKAKRLHFSFSLDAIPPGEAWMVGNVKSTVEMFAHLQMGEEAHQSEQLI